jgi:NAD(P)H-flavin reductase
MTGMPKPANPYLPEIADVVEVIEETHNIKTFRLRLDEEKMKNFSFEPGQVGQLSVFGSGESTFVINSPPTRMDYLQFSVMRVGELTTKLHSLKAGDRIGVRAPLGNFFPYEDMKGKDIVFIGGGIGMAPLRTLLLFMLDNRKDYGDISLLYGARSPNDMAFSYELPDWLERKDLNTVLTIDNPFEGWEHSVGLIPNVLLEMEPKPKNTVAVTCGPPIMIKFTIQALKKLGFEDDQIVTTLEKRMKCGIGICGRCNIGTKYVCVDGPVFSYSELKALPNEL